MRKVRSTSVFWSLLLVFVSTASRGSVPPGTSIDNQASASYMASGGASTTAGSNVVHVITQTGTAALTLNKSASQTSAKPGDHPIFTLAVNNSGSADAAGVAITIDGVAVTRLVISDAIPNNTRFASIVNAGGATPLYHIFGTAAQAYAGAPPSDLSTIDAVAFALTSLTAGGSASFAFSVAVDSNANGNIHNVAQVAFNNGADIVVPSNPVDIPVSGPPPSIAYFLDSSFSRTIQATAISSPLWVQIDAAACNLDPSTVESKPITLKSQLTGDTETFTATETGPNTGLFRILPSVPTRDAAINPVVSGNQIMEVLRNDQVIASLSGCGAGTVTVSILIDPAGTIFDSHTNAAVAGASVTLIDVTGNGNGGHANSPAAVFQFDGVTPAPSTVVTGTNGQFQFPQVLPSTYRIAVTPPPNFTFPSTVPPAQLPAGRHIDASASYNGTFTITAGSATAVFDVPLDAAASTSMFLQKTVAQTQAEIGTFIDYNVQIKNLNATPVANVQVTDRLPPGFVYQSRSARLNAGLIADPPSKGPVLVFNVGTLAANADVNLTYRILVGPGANIGVNVNRASAASGTLQSNSSSAAVNVIGGAFSDRGFIVGKVFQDCNGNHIQDPGEPGVPGVRIYLEDGTFAITDGQGKYSIYGVASRTHVLKIDTESLPPGAKLLATSSRNAGDGRTRFVDLRWGEMQKADFAIGTCTAEIAREIETRRKKAGEEKEVATAIKGQFNVQEIQKDPTQLKAMPASGMVSPTSSAQPNAANAMPMNLSSSRQASAVVSSPGTAAPTATPEPAVELASLNNQLGFVDLHDNDVLPFAQTNVRVKGVAGNTFRLIVNGREIAAKQVGTKSLIADRQLEVWEFIGIQLQPGRNLIQALQFDPWGNNRGSKEVVIVAPSKLGRLKIESQARAYPADGKTPVRIAISLTDAANIPVTVRTPITLETTAGSWMVKDLNPNEPGTQVFIEGGKAVFDLQPPIQPGAAVVRVSSGGVSSEAKIDFVPELRPMLAAGVVEYQLNFGGLARSAVQPSFNDGFEQQLNLFSLQNADGSFGSSGHAALFLKGKILGQNLLTLAYDSDKTTRSQLFRDIQPDQFYPIYGDSSIRGFDAQSTSKAFLRIDHGTSYVVYGDFLTSDPSTANSLSNYSRSMTGVQEHFSNSRVNMTGFASYDSLTQVVDELPANGTSGPFILSNPNGVQNSEKVEVLTRDRNQPSVILDIRQLTPFADYEFEPLSGELLLKVPLPTLDSNLNLVSLRITYEVNSGGERFWVGGGTGTIKLNKLLQVGGTFIDDSNPVNPNKLFGISSKLTLPGKTAFSAEFAGTDHVVEGLGFGYRLEMQHDGERLKSKAYFGRTDQDFDNATSILNKGRGEDGLKTSYTLGHGLRLLGEFIRTEDVNLGGVQQGGHAAIEKSFSGNIQTQFGFRHAETTALPASPDQAGTTPNSLNTLEGKLSFPMPHFNRLTVNSDYEQDVSDCSKRVLGFGANYRFWEKGRVYFRQEVISSLGDIYALNPLQRRNSTQIGVESVYFKDARVFSEYRIHDDIDGRDAQAAIGLRNKWRIAKGFTANTSVESIRTLNNVVSTASVNSLALTGGLEYTAHENWKASARSEWRGSTNGDSVLGTIGFAARLSDSWSFLGRNIISDITTKGTTETRHIQDRLQTGFALRDFERNRWNALAMVEYKNNNDNSQPTNLVKTRVGIFSTTANYQVVAPFTLSARYAAEWNLDNTSSLSTSAATQLIGTRATWDLSKRWDMGASVSTLYNGAARAQQYEFGPELGYRVISNMWVSTGYNLTGFRNDDLAGENVTRRGAFVRMRFKFDENTFTPRTKRP